jgi:mercuric ion transport protein
MQKKASRTGCPEGRCHCQKRIPATGVSKATKTAPSAVLSFFIAFFPKCPVCWAAYMSMFGGVGLAKLPYMKWLFPVLLILLGVHLFILYRGAARRGYLPFIISVMGSIVVIFSRTFFPMEKPLLLLGMIAIIAGSLLNANLIKLIKHGNSPKGPQVHSGHL